MGFMYQNNAKLTGAVHERSEFLVLFQANHVGSKHFTNEHQRWNRKFKGAGDLRNSTSSTSSTF